MSKPCKHSDPHDLARFVEAQAHVYETALAELRAGCKESHWMWFVFPQIEGLGRSVTARRYAIASLAEAKAYLSHPLLGPHLVECASAALDVEGKSAQEIFGFPDWMKFRSSMTLFAEASGAPSVFHTALAKFFSGEPDAATLDSLARLANGD